MTRHTINSFADARKLLQARTRTVHARPAYMLEHMQRFMAYLGNPQDRLRVIHIAGTSGKTSTSYFVASLLHESGKKTGLCVSPFVQKLNERLQIDMVPMAEGQYCSELTEFMDLVDKSDISLTIFEVLTAFAYWEFARQRVDYVVMEVGLGGELDATNVVVNPSKVSVITDIGLDHQRHLGATLPEIAQKKAGIIQLHNKVVVRAQGEQVLGVIRARARQKQADLYIADQEILPDTFGFLPLFQKRNFALAQAAVEAVSERDGIAQLGEGSLLRAARVHIPARMETHRIGDKIIILDGAHNEQKMDALAASLKQRYPGMPIAALAAFKSKRQEQVESATRGLTDFAEHIMVTTYGDPDNDTGKPYGEDPNIVAALCKVHGFWNIETCADPVQGWRQLLRRPEPILVVTGSLYLFNDIYPLLGDHVWPGSSV